MADNEKSYKATIDVETNSAAKNMDLLNKTVSTSLGEFDNLNEAISKTQDTLGKLDPNSKAFKELSGELQNLKDDLRDTEIQSSRFTEALAAQPGVMGLVGQSLEGLRGTMKVFMANPIIAVVTAIAGAFLAMRESLTKTAEGQETLNRISEAFGKIMGPIFAVIESVALPIFEKFADLLGLVADGFNRFAVMLGISQSKIDEASRASSEVLQKSYDEEIARQEALTKKEEEERQKRIDAAQREADEKQRILELAAAIQREAELSILDERTRALTEREERYQKDLAALKAAGYTDFTALEAEYVKDLFAIRQNAGDAEKVQLVEINDEKKRINLGFEKDTGKEIIVVQKENAEASKKITEEEQATKLLIVSNTLGQLAQAVGENTVAGKALAVAQATINTFQGATLALASYPPPFGAIAAATVIAAGLISVKKIVSTKVPAPPGTKGISSSSGAGGDGSSLTPPSIPTPVASFAAPQIQAGGAGQGDASTQIAETIAQAQQRPIRAYVVSQDISSKQAMDRRVNSAASL